MDKNLTVSVRGLLVTGLVVVALAVAYLLGGSGAGTSPARAAEEPAAPAGAARTVTMSGIGTASAVPDQLAFQLSVGVTRPDLDAALADSSATMKRVVAVLTDGGVDKKDIQTTGLSMNPVYDYPQYGPPVLTGYRVGQRASVLVQDLGKGGRLIGLAVSTGGNGVRVSNLRLQVGDTHAVYAEARKAAVETATAKATEYAEATGQALGDVLTLREVSPSTASSSYPQALADEAAYDRAAKSVVPVSAGEDELVARVQVIWELS